jgi:hypothetical protein
MNLTSDAARSRVMREINTRYRRITSSIGLTPTRRTRVSKAATIGNTNITFSAIEKIDQVIRLVGGEVVIVDEITYDEMLAEAVTGGEPPTKWALYSVAYNSVTIRMNCTPTTTFTLYADGLATVTNLAGNSSPAFAESFHDAIIYGVMAEEYRKMEKPQFMQECKDLRMHLAKSAYLDIYAGKLGENEPWIYTYRRDL